MTGLILCTLAFFSTFFVGIISWRFSLCVLIIWGYFFGILKANYVDSAGHFIFDASTFGFYLSLLINYPKLKEKAAWSRIWPWFVALMVWPIFISLIPLQHYLIQLVGLRGNILWLPVLLVGSMLDLNARHLISLNLVVLNWISLAFGIAEYLLGVEVFIPSNQATNIVYLSNDIAGGYLRIPSIFANAHSYAGTMVATVPWIYGELIDNRKSKIKMVFLVSGLVAAAIGIFLAGPRQPVVVLGMVLLIYFFMGRNKLIFVSGVLIISMIASYFIYQNERMQRFTDLQDLDKVRSRVEMSLNSYFVDLIMDYPMGIGMGAGGTSIPFFLQQHLNEILGLENEYSRILLEQGLPGLILWLAFTLWLFTRQVDSNDNAFSTKKMNWVYAIVVLSTAWIGIGLMTTVPGTVLLMLSIGLSVAPGVACNFENRPHSTIPRYSKLNTMPAYQRGLARA